MIYEVESVQGMELILNLAWGLLAIASICLWAATDRRKGAERYMPIVALFMLIIILFPVISVSDDLWSIQNPAETNSVQRRDHLVLPPHSIIPALISFCRTSEINLGFRNWTARADVTTPALCVPPRIRIQNRPPPAV